MLSLFKTQFNTISDPENRVTELVVENLKNATQQNIGLLHNCFRYHNIYMIDIR